MKHIKRSLVAMILVVAALLLVACGQRDAAGGNEEEPAIIEEVPGSEFNRVILTQKAAERLDIQTEPVSVMEGDEAGSESDKSIVQEGEVTDPHQGLVRVALDRNTLGKVDAAGPTRVLFDADDDEDEGFLAELFEPPDADDPEDEDEDGEDEDGELFFVVNDAAQDLTQGQSVYVKLSLAKTGSGPSVVPYSAIVYGLSGETWVYTNPETLTFIRHPVAVDRIEGGQVILSDGPPPGTEVVTVGAALLLGADTGVGK